MGISFFGWLVVIGGFCLVFLFCFCFAFFWASLQHFLTILLPHTKYVAKCGLDFSHCHHTIELYGKVTLCPKGEKKPNFDESLLNCYCRFSCLRGVEYLLVLIGLSSSKDLTSHSLVSKCRPGNP